MNGNLSFLCIISKMFVILSKSFASANRINAILDSKEDFTIITEEQAENKPEQDMDAISHQIFSAHNLF